MRIEIVHVGLFGWFLSLPPADHMVCLLLFPHLVVSVRVHSGQIADLKRGAEVVVCTPGRMIDILCMQAGKMVSLKRVTMVRHARPIALNSLPSLSPRPSPKVACFTCFALISLPPLVGPIPRSFWTRQTGALTWVSPRRST